VKEGGGAPPHCKETIPKTRNKYSQKYGFPEIKLSGFSPNFHIHVSVSDLHIPTIGLPILLQENRWWEYVNRSQIDESGNWD
jgi:hypothetical protein